MDTGASAKVVMKRRKPRAPAVVSAANDRARKEHHQVSVKKNGRPSAARPRSEESRKRKGLRHFAIRVSQKVQLKQSTTYNEVADELVNEERALRERNASMPTRSGPTVDEKNVRRRVYDSLNVLMAMGIIERDRKTIVWRGLAHARMASNARLHEDIAERRRVVDRKRAFAATVAEQTANLDALVARNRALHAPLLLSVDDAPVHRTHADRLDMPFLLVATANDTSISLQVDAPREDVAFTLAKEFTLYDDREILRRIRLPVPDTVAAAAAQPVSLSNNMHEHNEQLSAIPAIPTPTPRVLATEASHASSLDKGVAELDTPLHLAESFVDSFL